MKSGKYFLRVLVSVLTSLSMLLGMVPIIKAETSAIYLPLKLREFGPPVSSTSQPLPVWPTRILSGTLQISSTVYLPLMARNYMPPIPNNLVVYPGRASTLKSANGQVTTTFTSIAVTQSTAVQLTDVAPPAVPPSNLAVAGQGFSITAQLLATEEAVTYFPYDIKVFTDTSPWYSVYTPSVIITKTYTDPEVWGLDLTVLSLYRRIGPGRDDWMKVPSAVYLDQNTMVAEVERIGEFVMMSRLAIYDTGSATRNRFSVQSPMSDSNTFKKLVLDPDRDEGWAIWPGVGKIHEGPYAVRLAQAVRERLQNDRCRVDILLTREDENAYGEPPAARAQMYQRFGGDTLATFAFNSLTGGPWGGNGDGGTIIWSGGDSADNAFRDTMGSWIGNLGRPMQYDRPHAVLPYTAFVALPGAYMHMETLYLDHNYDWLIIDTGFDSSADMAYAGVRKRLEAAGMYCGDDPNNPPPYPAPPLRRTAATLA